MAHVAEWKKQYVDDLVQVVMEKPVVGIVNIHGIPAKQMQTMRASIRDIMLLKGSKNTLMKLAFEKAASQGKEGIDALSEIIDGQCAIVTTELNSFKLYKRFQETLTPTPAKGGEIAPDDIVIKKGETQFKPGPLVSEFQRAGLPAAIDRGKIIIKKNTKLVKKGEVISREVAGALTKLEVFPLTVGLDLIAAWEKGMVFKPDTLRVDEGLILSQLKLASIQALNLAVFTGYPTKKTIVPILQKAFNQALSLSVNTGFPTSESMKMILAKARSQMIALATILGSDALDPDLQELLSSTAVSPPPPPTSYDRGSEKSEPEDEEEEEESEVTEEEAAAGLGTLFG